MKGYGVCWRGGKRAEFVSEETVHASKTVRGKTYWLCRPGTNSKRSFRKIMTAMEGADSAPDRDWKLLDGGKS